MWSTWVSGTQVEQGRLGLAGLGYLSPLPDPELSATPLQCFLSSSPQPSSRWVSAWWFYLGVHLKLIWHPCKLVRKSYLSFQATSGLCKGFHAPVSVWIFEALSHSSMGSSAGWSQLTRVEALSFYRAQARTDHTEKCLSGQNITVH